MPTLDLTSRQQLLDLNEETTNFDLSFTATSQDGSPFEAVVVDQTTLDNNPNLEYQRAEGTISGNIISDKNVYQNYFLSLKSETPCKVDVTIEKKEIPPNLEPQVVEKPSQFQSSINWRYVIITLLVIGGCAFLYYMYTTKEKTPLLSPMKSSVADTPMSSSYSSSTSSSSPSYDGSSIEGLKVDEDLIGRLNNLPLK